MSEVRRLEALGQLTGGVAHDFNNLLMVIQGGLGLLSRRVTDERSRRQIGIMSAAVERGANLTGQLLAFGRRQPLQPRPIDVRGCLEQVRKMARAASSPRIEVEVQVSASTWPILADPFELERSLINLCMNARDAMPDGGTLTLMGRNAPTAVTTKLGLAGDYVELAVKDTGQGISEDLQARVFDPFYTTKPPGKGTGLGLSQVYGFGEQSGGRVRLESAVGHGTTVSLFLARSVESPTVLADAPLGKPIDLARRSVLLVEDNAEVAETTRDMLCDAGLLVVTANNGEAALEASTHQGPFDFVLSDIVMPGPVDGFELATRIRTTNSRALVILMSGYTASLDKAERLGVPILRKPFGIDDLVSLMAKHDPSEIGERTGT